MPTVPVNAAGWRMEPPVSVPVAASAIRAATAAEDPPDEPPGTSFLSYPEGRQGLITGPVTAVSVDDPMANSSMATLPSITAPSRHKLAVTVDSYCGLKPVRILLDAWAATPLVQNRSLMASGMPASGPAWP